jgi:hypothetical protein
VALAALIVSIVSALTAIGSVLYTKQSANAATATAALDAERRQAELTPRFHITCERWNTGSDKLRLTVQLTGPLQLGALDELTFKIRDDHHWRAEHEPLAGGPTREQIAAQVWGQWRLTPGSVPNRGPGVDANGQTCTEPDLPVGEALSYQLEPTWPPSWSQQSVESWQAQMGTLLRFTLECRRDGYKPWVLPAELAFDGLGTASTGIPQALN